MAIKLIRVTLLFVLAIFVPCLVNNNISHAGNCSKQYQQYQNSKNELKKQEKNVQDARAAYNKYIQEQDKQNRRKERIERRRERRNRANGYPESNYRSIDLDMNNRYELELKNEINKYNSLVKISNEKAQKYNRCIGR